MNKVSELVPGRRVLLKYKKAEYSSIFEWIVTTYSKNKLAVLVRHDAGSGQVVTKWYDVAKLDEQFEFFDDIV